MILVVNRYTFSVFRNATSLFAAMPDGNLNRLSGDRDLAFQSINPADELID